MSNQENSEEEIQKWLDQVHFGSCCSDDADDCKSDKELSEEEPLKEDSKTS